MALSVVTPEGSSTTISTFLAVLSTTCLIFILPLSFAFKIESINDSVVTPKGNSRITNVFLSTASIFARTWSFPPRFPALYSEASIEPPVGKSGIKFVFLPFNTAIEASINSLKLCGRIFVLKPTAIPSTP